MQSQQTLGDGGSAEGYFGIVGRGEDGNPYPLGTYMKIEKAQRMDREEDREPNRQPHMMVDAVGIGCFRIHERWQVDKVELARVRPIEYAPAGRALCGAEAATMLEDLVSDFRALAVSPDLGLSFPGLGKHLQRQLAKEGGIPQRPELATWWMAHALPLPEHRYRMLEVGLKGPYERLRMLQEVIAGMRQQAAIAGLPDAGSEAD